MNCLVLHLILVTSHQIAVQLSRCFLPTQARVCLHMLVCACTCSCVPAHARVCLHMLMCACTGSCVPAHARVCLHMLVCACTCSCVPAHARVCLHMLNSLCLGRVMDFSVAAIHYHHGCPTTDLFVLYCSTCIWFMGCIIPVFFACMNFRFPDLEPKPGPAVSSSYGLQDTL